MRSRGGEAPVLWLVGHVRRQQWDVGRRRREGGRVGGCASDGRDGLVKTKARGSQRWGRGGQAAQATEMSHRENVTGRPHAQRDNQQHTIRHARTHSWEMAPESWARDAHEEHPLLPPRERERERERTRRQRMRGAVGGGVPGEMQAGEGGRTRRVLSWPNVMRKRSVSLQRIPKTDLP